MSTKGKRTRCPDNAYNIFALTLALTFTLTLAFTFTLGSPPGKPLVQHWYAGGTFHTPDEIDL